MSHDSTALSLDEKTAYSFFTTAGNMFTEVACLRQQNYTLTQENTDHTVYIAELEADNRALTASRNSYRYDLEAEQATADNLRAEIAQLRAALAAEQLLAGQHWSNLQTVTAERNLAENALADTTTTLAATTTKLAEAEATLSKFRDILGLPVPTPEVNEHPPIPLEIPAVYNSSPEPEQVTLPPDVTELPTPEPLTEQVSLRPDESSIPASTPDLLTPIRGSERYIIEDWI